MILSDRHHRALLELVGEANGASGLDDFREIVVASLRRAIPADYVSYNELACGRALATVVDPELPDWAHEAWARHADQNPLVSRFMRTRDSRPYRWSDVADEQTLQERPLFEELYAPLGIRHQVAFNLPSPPELLIGVALSRSTRDFDDGEREMLYLARPHLIQAYRAAQLRDRLGSHLASARSGLEAGGIGLLVVDENDEICFATSYALEGLALAGHPDLTEGDPVPRELVATGFRTVSLADQTILIRRLQNERGQTVLVVEQSRSGLSRRALEGLGLTTREADVLAEFALGRETEEAADRLGIAVGTLHKHARAIHAKLGVQTRAQAVAAAWAAMGAAAHAADLAGAL